MSESEGKKLTPQECLDYARKVLDMLPEGGVKNSPGYQAKWLVVELVAESLGGRGIWDWQRN